jgi:alcohol dehydrogenase
MGFNLIYLYQNAHKMKKILEELEKLALGKPYVGHVFDFLQLKEALKLFQSGSTTGKVVVKVER